MNRFSATTEEQIPHARVGPHDSRNGTPKYHVANRIPGDATEGLSASKIVASHWQDAMANKLTPSHPHLPAKSPQLLPASNTVADNDAMMKTALSSPSRHQSTIDGPQSHRTTPQAQQPSADLQQPVPLDLQCEYSLVREHVSRKDIASSLPAIASIPTLRSCMAALKDAAKMNSEAWFLMEREKIDEELVRGGFARLPMV